jgi:hypothetical protein
MGERYYLGVNWGPRKESVHDSAARVMRALEGLKELEPELFSRWYVWRREKGEPSLELPLSVDANGVTNALRLTRHESDAPPKPDIDERGFTLDVWNGETTPELACMLELSLGIFPGGWNIPAPNECELHLPAKLPERLLEPARMSRLLALLARAFDADWGAASTNQHMMASMGVREPGAPLVGWLVFLSSARGRPRRALPAGATAETLEGLGTIYTASPTFHWPSSDALREALEKGKLIGPTGAAPAQTSSHAGGDAYEAALELAVAAQALAEKAPRVRQRRAEALADAAAALVVARDREGVARVSALLDLAHRLALASDDDREILLALLARVEAEIAQ